MRWKGWQNEAACTLQAGTFASRKELELIMKVCDLFIGELYSRPRITEKKNYFFHPVVCCNM
jgi:hypothetical protein